MKEFFPLLFLALWAGDAMAADFSISVRDKDGKAVADAVVTLTPQPNAAATPVKHSQEPALYEMAQKDITFMPHILAVPKGQSVSFPNQDTVRHHVYSFSKAKRFALSLYGKDDAPRVTFDETGVVAIGCNIHDKMKAYVYVHDAPYSITTNAKGAATLNNLVSGDYLVQIWHPRLKSKNAPIERLVAIAEGATERLDVNISMRPARRPIRSSYH